MIGGAAHGLPPRRRPRSGRCARALRIRRRQEMLGGGIPACMRGAVRGAHAAPRAAATNGRASSRASASADKGAGAGEAGGAAQPPQPKCNALYNKPYITYYESILGYAFQQKWRRWAIGSPACSDHAGTWTPKCYAGSTPAVAVLPTRRVVIKPANRHLGCARTGSNNECHAGCTPAGHGQVRGAEAARGAPAGARPAGSATSLQGQIATACRLRQAATKDSMRIQRQGSSRCAGARARRHQGRRRATNARLDAGADAARRVGRRRRRAPALQSNRKDSGGGRGRRAASAPTPPGRPAQALTHAPAGSRLPRTGSGP